MRPFIIFILILLLAAFFRFYGLNWDANQHLHPDERFLTMVTGAISWPENIRQYLDTDASPLNPQNRGFGFFVYGTFPVFFTKYAAEIFRQADYNGITLIGRKLSALFDLGTVILVFLIAGQIKKSLPQTAILPRRQAGDRNPKTIYFPHLAMFLYASMVLPIQLSHFYAMETYLTFLITLSFFLLIKIQNSNFLILNSLLLGTSFGLALASKITAALFLPIIGISFIHLFFARPAKRGYSGVSCFLFLVICYLTLRLGQPYLFAGPDPLNFTLNQKVLNNWKELKSFDDPSGGFPPAVQWITTKPYIFPLKNMIFWGLGLPLGLSALLSVMYQVAGIIYRVFKKKIYLILNTKYLILNLSLLWILMIFIYQGSQFVKALRYFFPVYPFLAILSSWFLLQITILFKINKKLILLFVICYLLFVLIYPFSFISIYSRPHSRIAASEWIYKNIPSGSVISSEHWDDGLPMSLPQTGYIHEKYQVIEFPLYWLDDERKWTLMNQNLTKVDYIFLTSNRLYGSIMTVPDKYPVTSKFYNSLFDGSLGFEKVAEFTSRPNLNFPFMKLCLTPPFVRYGIVAAKSRECPLPGISFVDDYADETFTVYDHPKVIIFKKVKTIEYYRILFKN